MPHVVASRQCWEELLLDPSVYNLRSFRSHDETDKLCELICRGQVGVSFKRWKVIELLFIAQTSKPELTDWEGQLDANITVAHERDQIELFLFGVFLLNSFIQANWTGPNLGWNSADALFKFLSDSTPIQSWALDRLAVDGEDVYCRAVEPVLFYLAKRILSQTFSKLSPLGTSWWKLRVDYVHQRLLDNPSNSLKVQLENVIQTIREHHASSFFSSELRVKCFLEMSVVVSYYKRDLDSLDYLKAAQKASGLEWSLTGEKGVRTRYQQTEVAQMVLSASSVAERAEREASAVNADGQPKNVSLNDDTLLEVVKLSNSGSIPKTRLWSVDQCILLAYCLNLKNMNPENGLTKEQMRPFIERVLEHANNWSVHSMALYLRSKLETQTTRTVERALFQIQALVDQAPLEETKCASDRSASAERLEHFFSLKLPSFWELERDLGELYMSLGAAASALAIFEKLQLWDLVVSCYIVMEKHKDAEAILRQQLDLNPSSASLLTTLGDLTKDKDMLRRAWCLNPSRKFPRAMRCLGALYFKEENYSEAARCYSEALKINPLYENAWFVYGCACIRCEDWTDAAEAFRKCTQLDHENSEAWNNLASVYLHLGEDQNAFRALAHAVKVNFDNERIWQNYMYVAVNAGDWAQVMHAMDHLVNIRYPKLKEGQKSQCIDMKTLKLLVDVATDTSAEVKLVVQKPNVKLLGAFLLKLSQQVATSPEVFFYASRFFVHVCDFEKGLDFAEKAFRALLNRIGTIPNVEGFGFLGKVSLFTLDLYSKLATQGEPGGTDWGFKSRSLIRSFKSRCMEQYNDEELFKKVVEYSS